MGAIDPNDVSQVVGKCIKCCACVKKCPKGAKYFDHEGYLYHQHELEDQYAGRRAQQDLPVSGYIPGQGAPSALALAKSELCEACHLLYQRGYVASNDGNLSLRLDDGRFLITPSGVSKGPITPEMLDKAIHQVTEKTFNMISIDGDTSTNDTFAILANGAAGN